MSIRGIFVHVMQNESTLTELLERMCCEDVASRATLQNVIDVSPRVR